MDNKPSLINRLAHFFRLPALLRASSTAVKSNRSLSAGESTRSFSAAGDIAHEPIVISRSRVSEADELYCALLRRSFSLDRRPRRDLCPPSSPSLESPNSAKNKRKKKMKMKQRQRSRSNRHELSISSSFGKEGFGFFNRRETYNFFSSRSFFSDSSEFYRRPSPKSRKSSTKTELNKNSKFSSRRRRRAAVTKIPNFQPLVSISFSEENEAEKTRIKDFPVLITSTDPYNDFRSSIAEMIVERQIFGARELEGLLHSYLSLNPPDKYSAIF